MDAYHYTESGLDNVIIEGLAVSVADDGEEVYHIPRVNLLHRAITAGIVLHKAAIAPKELRFLRTELGMTQAELARIVHVDTQTVGRWERGETPIAPTAEVVVRRLAVERLGLSEKPTIEELASRVVPMARSQPIRIVADVANDDQPYRLAA
jgi:DNA-binding transcriptional regulator YiaG